MHGLYLQSCKEGEARATPALPLEICYGIWQGSRGHRGSEPAQEHQASQKLLLPRLASITSLTVLSLVAGFRSCIPAGCGFTTTIRKSTELGMGPSILLCCVCLCTQMHVSLIPFYFHQCPTMGTQDMIWVKLPNIYLHFLDVARFSRQKFYLGG